VRKRAAFRGGFLRKRPERALPGLESRIKLVCPIDAPTAHGLRGEGPFAFAYQEGIHLPFKQSIPM